MKASLLIFVLIVPLAGCNSTQMVREGFTDQLAEINAQGTRQTALVTLSDGQQVRATALRVSPDSTSWVYSASGHAARVPTTDVIRVEFTSRGRGALEGAGVGLAVGALSSGIAMAVSWEPCRSTGMFSCIMHPSSAGEAAMTGAVVGGVGGVLWGALIGTAVGGRRTYQLEPTPVKPPPVAFSSDAGSER
jgi:hypothetical protein